LFYLFNFIFLKKKEKVYFPWEGIMHFIYALIMSIFKLDPKAQALNLALFPKAQALNLALFPKAQALNWHCFPKPRL